ncbi:hypothetical protein JEP63_02765 [Proteus mirabilis]|nr:hypothetical protein [Proteus mirabilis]
MGCCGRSECGRNDSLKGTYGALLWFGLGVCCHWRDMADTQDAAAELYRQSQRHACASRHGFWLGMGDGASA